MQEIRLDFFDNAEQIASGGPKVLFDVLHPFESECGRAKIHWQPIHPFHLSGSGKITETDECDLNSFEKQFRHQLASVGPYSSESIRGDNYAHSNSSMESGCCS